MVKQDGGEVNAITASTITSRAFLRAVTQAWSAYRGDEDDAKTGATKQEEKIEKLEVKGNNDVLMDRIMKNINESIQDPDFNVEKLTAQVGISRAQLHRKMKEITGISAGDFIRNLRLEQAARLICENKINVTQVAYAVGFNDPKYFTRCFTKMFGMSPRAYGAH